MAHRAFTADGLQAALDALDRVFQDNELPEDGVLKEGVLSDELHEMGISRELAKVLVDGLIEAGVFRPDKRSLIEIRERQSSLFGGPTVDMGSRVSRRLHFSRDTWQDYINKEHERRADAKRASPKKKRRRRAGEKKLRPLTAKEAEAMQLVGEHKGNVSAAAKQAGVSRQAMEKRYRNATRKLGKAAVQRPKEQRLPTDRRGQETVADTADE